MSAPSGPGGQPAGQTGSGPGFPGRDSERRVVVGVDGSEHSLAALDWAAAEAERLHAVLDIRVHWITPVALGFPVPRGAAGDYERSAKAVLEHALSRVRERHPHLAVRTVATEAIPAPALVDASSDATLLVVGSRGFGGFRGLVLGSVSQHCAQHAHCPVLIVRGAHGEAP